MVKQLEYAFLLLPLLAFGWGRGHDVVGGAVASRLPEPWRSALQGEALRQFCADNHYPDSPLKVADDKRVTPGERAYLASLKITGSYQFHSDEGRGAAFTLLVRAMRENRRESALLWLGVLSHSTADMVACNHDPIAHQATYGWGDAEWALQLPNGLSLAKMQPCLDLGWVESEPAAKAVWKAQLDEVAAADSGKGAEDALLDVMLAGIQGVEACAPYGLPIVRNAASWTGSKNPESKMMLAENLSALGCWAVERLLRDVLAAERLAKAGADPELTEAVSQRYQAAFAEFVSSRTYEEDSFVKGLVSPLNAESPYLAVVSEPTWRMNEGMFGFNDRVLAAQTVTALRKQGKNAALMDVRLFMSDGLPVAKAPALMIFAQKVNAYYSLQPKALTEQLTLYRQRGGKVIWIGGGLPDRALCDFPKQAASLAAVGAGYAYSWTRLPVGTNAYATLTLKVGDCAVRKLERSPCFRAGWHIPSNITYFQPEAAASLRVLATLYDGARPLPVGGAWPKAAPEVVYLPVYAVFPYLWTRETPALAPLELGLDSQGLDSLSVAFAALQVDRLLGSEHGREAVEKRRRQQ